MRFWNAVDRIRATTEQTVSDDARSRLARRDYDERNRIQRIEYDDDGNALLWFDVSITVGNHSGVPIAWAGSNVDEVNQAVIEWLKENEFITVDLVDNGARKKMTFRSSFVAHWEVGSGRARR